ncbi:MAG: hypothetical protein H6695_13875 [Deferribacteres bacterium]|nr:hypothetical protein [candidate division KSB1 bacterium]MCB9511275.1 hypothetical protein [Deferribacteres bacterium]
MSETPKTLAVGDEVFTECGKCKSEMYHVITAMSGDKIRKVMCKGCNTTHLYKDKAEKAKKKSAAKEKKVTKPRRRIRKYDWDALSSDIEEDELVDYQLAADLSEARGIRHKSFGIGVITKVISEKQIEVLFKDEMKILVHNYQAQ